MDEVTRLQNDLEAPLLKHYASTINDLKLKLINEQKKYEKLKEDFDHNLIVIEERDKELEENEKVFTALSDKIETYEKILEEKNQKIRNFDEKIQILEKNSEDSNAEISALKEENRNLSLEICDKNNLIKIENREKNYLKKSLEEAREKIIKLERIQDTHRSPKVEIKQDKYEKIFEKSKKLKEQNHRLKLIIKNMESDFEMTELKWKLSECELNDRIAELSSANSSLSEEISEIFKKKEKEFDSRLSVIEKEYSNRFKSMEKAMSYELSLSQRSAASLKSLLEAAKSTNNDLIQRINEGF